MDPRSIGPRSYAYAGIAAVIIMVVAVLFCIIFDTNWDYLGEAASLCNFGVSEFWYVSVAFIGGCVVSGLLFTFSGFGWYLFDKSVYNRYSGLVISLAGISLICVGIFDKTFWFHQYVSVVFAVIFIIAIALASVQDILDKRWLLILGLIVVGLYGLSTMFIHIDPYTAYTVVQVIMMGYVFFWFVLKSIEFIHRCEPSAAE